MSLSLFSIIKSIYKVFDYTRERVYQKIVESQVSSFGDGLTVHGPTRLNSNTELGENVNFNGLRVYGSGRVKIEDNFHSGPNCKIHTENHNYHGEKIPYDETTHDLPVVIKGNVWIGQGVTILPGVTIHEGAIVQAESVVVDDVDSCSIVGGHPATEFSRRDRQHYERLKEDKEFL